MPIVNAIGKPIFANEQIRYKKQTYSTERLLDAHMWYVFTCDVKSTDK